MTAASPIPMNQGDIYESTGRLVWVLNRDPIHSYKGKFGGDEIEIPADRKKIAKPVTQGGNLMRHLDARHFITDFKEPQGWEKDRQGKEVPIFRTKELYSEELTLEEFERIVRKSPDQVKKEKVAETKRATKRLNKELNDRPGKVEVGEDDLS